MEPGNTSGRRQRTPEEIIELLKEFENSEGITIKEFCEINDISDATYYNWRKQYGSKSKEEKPSGFIELVNPAATSGSEPLFAEVKIIRLYQPVSADYFKTIGS
jgi:transposase-like protein